MANTHFYLLMFVFHALKSVHLREVIKENHKGISVCFIHFHMNDDVRLLIILIQQPLLRPSHASLWSSASTVLMMIFVSFSVI